MFRFGIFLNLRMDMIFTEMENGYKEKNKREKLMKKLVIGLSQFLVPMLETSKI